jgi:hypothetical protein
MLSIPRAELLLGLPVTESRWQTVVMITPDKARIILDVQPNQRPINAANLEKIKQDLLKGKFIRTHQGIAFDTEGLLSDGQHRLMACAETGIPIEIVANFNEPRELFPFYDQGHARRLSATLLLSGHVRNKGIAHSVAAGLGFLWHYDQGRHPLGIHKKNFDFDTACSVLAQHPMLPIMVERAKNHRKVPFPLSPSAAMFTLMYEGSSEKASIFIEQCLTGERLSKGDPAYAVRESILGSVNQDPDERSYKLARAWNAFYEDRKLLHVYGSKSGRVSSMVRTRDAFPDIAGYARPVKTVEDLELKGMTP